MKFIISCCGLSARMFHDIYFILDLEMAATGPYNYSYIFKYIIIGKYVFLLKHIAIHSKVL